MGICRRLPRCCTGAAFSSKSEEDLVSCLTAAHGQASQGRCQTVTCIGRTAGPSGQCFQLLDARLLNEQGLGAEVVLLIHVPERFCGKVSERQNHFVLMYLCQEYRIVMVEQRPPPPLAPSRRNKPPHPPTRTNIPGKNLRSLSAGWKTWEVCGSRRTRGRSCPRRVFLVLSLLCFLMQLVDGGWVLDCAVRAPAARESAHVSRWMAEGEAGWWRCCWGAWVVGRGVFLVCCCC